MCIFNVLLRFQYSIPFFQSLFALRCRSSHLQKMVPAVAAIGKNTAAILTDRRQRENKCGRFRDKHLKFQSYFKEIMLPDVVSLHACRSAGRGRGRLSGFPCMM